MALRDRSDGIGRGASPADDDEARALGWPCLGAWGAMAGRIVAGAPRPVVFVEGDDSH